MSPQEKAYMLHMKLSEKDLHAKWHRVYVYIDGYWPGEWCVCEHKLLTGMQ